MGYIWIFGMILNISGSVMVNFGTNLMKSAHILFSESQNLSADSEDDDENEKQPSVASKRIWRLGMTIFVIGSLVNFASFAFAAQTLLAALGTVQFVSNVIFGKLVLKEEMTPRVICATAIICTGLIIAIIFSNHATVNYTSDELIALYNTTYILFLVGLLLFLLSLHAIYTIYTGRLESGKPLYGTNFVRPATYAVVSATVGTQSTLQSKCLAELLEATFSGDNQFTKWFIYVLLVAFLVGLQFWLYRMNKALQKFDGLIIIPLLQVCWTTSAIMQGGVYFQEFQGFTTIQIVCFVLGVSTVFVGVYFLTPVEAAGDEDLLEEDEEEAMVAMLAQQGIAEGGVGYVAGRCNESPLVASDMKTELAALAGAPPGRKVLTPIRQFSDDVELPGNSSTATGLPAAAAASRRRSTIRASEPKMRAVSFNIMAERGDSQYYVHARRRSSMRGGAGNGMTPKASISINNNNMYRNRSIHSATVAAAAAALAAGLPMSSDNNPTVTTQRNIQTQVGFVAASALPVTEVRVSWLEHFLRVNGICLGSYAATGTRIALGYYRIWRTETNLCIIFSNILGCFLMGLLSSKATAARCKCSSTADRMYRVAVLALTVGLCDTLTSYAAWTEEANKSLFLQWDRSDGSANGSYNGGRLLQFLEMVWSGMVVPLSFYFLGKHIALILGDTDLDNCPYVCNDSDVQNPPLVSHRTSNRRLNGASLKPMLEVSSNGTATASKYGNNNSNSNSNNQPPASFRSCGLRNTAGEVRPFKSVCEMSISGISAVETLPEEEDGIGVLASESNKPVAKPSTRFTASSAYEPVAVVDRLGGGGGVGLGPVVGGGWCSPKVLDTTTVVDTVGPLSPWEVLLVGATLTVILLCIFLPLFMDDATWTHIAYALSMGGVGALLRYALSLCFGDYYPFLRRETITFPWGTFLSNVVSCWLLAAFNLMSKFAVEYSNLEIKYLLYGLSTGFCGSLSTLAVVAAQVDRMMTCRKLGLVYRYLLLTCFVGQLGHLLLFDTAAFLQAPTKSLYPKHQKFCSYFESSCQIYLEQAGCSVSDRVIQGCAGGSHVAQFTGQCHCTHPSVYSNTSSEHMPGLSDQLSASLVDALVLHNTSMNLVAVWPRDASEFIDPSNVYDICLSFENLCQNLLERLDCPFPDRKINGCGRRSVLHFQGVCECRALSVSASVHRMLLTTTLTRRMDLLPYVIYPTRRTDLDYCSSFVTVCRHALDHINCPLRSRTLTGCESPGNYSSWSGQCVCGGGGWQAATLLQEILVQEMVRRVSWGLLQYVNGSSTGSGSTPRLDLYASHSQLCTAVLDGISCPSNLRYQLPTDIASSAISLSHGYSYYLTTTSTTNVTDLSTTRCDCGPITAISTAVRNTLVAAVTKESLVRLEFCSFPNPAYETIVGYDPYKLMNSPSNPVLPV